MAKRGRRAKKKVPRKPTRSSTIISSEEYEKPNDETSNLSSSSQRQNTENISSGTTMDTSQDPLNDINEKSTTKLTKTNSNKKKIILTGARKKGDTSTDSDATEVYSMSSEHDDDNDEDYTVKSSKTKPIKRKTAAAAVVKVNHDLSDNSNDEDYTGKSAKAKPTKRKVPPSITPKTNHILSENSDDNDRNHTEKTIKTTSAKRKRKAAPAIIKVNHDLSENSDDNLTYSRRPITIKTKRRQRSSSSSSIFSDDNQLATRTCPPIPTFKQKKTNNNNNHNNKKKKSDDEIIITDEDYNTDVEKMDDNTLIQKTERRMLNDEDLTQMTKKALEEEKQRIQRIQQKQMQRSSTSQIIFNDNIVNGQTKKKDEEKETQLIFEYESNTNKSLIAVLPELVAKMKPHQLEGTMFLWDNVYESIAQIEKKSEGTGCILAHHMGLGKTFQLISFLHTIFKYTEITKARTCLILCPVNVISNWAGEFSHWLSGIRPTIKVHQFSLFKTKTARWERLKKWMDKGGVMLMGYEIYRRLSNDVDYNFFLSDPGPDIIVCDEGHVLKNANAGISKALTKIRTKRRIILTGTPLQNNLKEYYYMVHFVKPHLLGTYREFKNQFIDPIRGGQHKDSNIYAVQLMKRRAFALHERLKYCIHRRDFNVLRKYLPEKYEYVIKIYMGDLQKKLYNRYLEIQNIDPTAGLNTAKLFADYQYLMKIWTHPWLLRPHFIDRWKKRQKKDANEVDNIDPFFNDIIAGLSDDETGVDDELSKKLSTIHKRSSIKSKTSDSSHSRQKHHGDDDGNSSSNSLSSSSTSEFLSLFTNTNWKSTLSSSNKTISSSDPCQQAMQDEWWYSFFNEKAEFDISLSGKLIFLKTLLDECELIGDKVLLFSRSLFSLSYLEQFLKYWDSIATGKKTQADDFDAKVKPNGRWKFGIDYFRIDGSTDIATRTTYISKFNDPANIRSRLFIVSTMAGGIGINLIGSNRVVIFDCSWNPSSDLQALFRSYRLGQKKATYVYRLLSKGSMEEKIYFRQVNKQAMAQRVVDAQQLARHFTESELRELYSFKPEDDEPPIYSLKKFSHDIILTNCVEKNSSLVQNILEHDSLLEDHVEEQLTREEKYLAIKELEREERQAEYQSNVAKTLAAMAHNNHSNPNKILNTNLDSLHTEIEVDEPKKERKLVTLPPVNSFNPYQPPPPMCAQARASVSTVQEARGLERLTELLFPKEAQPLPSGKAAELPPLKDVTDMPVSKDDLEKLILEDEEFDVRTKKEKEKAQLQEQRAYFKLYNDKKKLLNPPKAPKVLKRQKKLPAVNTSVVTNPYQFMPVTLNPFDLPPNMQKRPD